MNWRTRTIIGVMTAVVMVVAAVPAASARQAGPSWQDGHQSAQRRAGELLAALTPAQKEALVVGEGVPELGVPAIS